MEAKNIKLRNDATLTIREAQKEDAADVLQYVEKMAGETDFLTFGQGEFNVSLEDEEKFLETYLELCKRIFERMEREGSWPWADSQNSENLVESDETEKDL